VTSTNRNPAVVVLSNTELGAFGTNVAAGKVAIGTFVYVRDHGDVLIVGLDSAGNPVLGAAGGGFTALSASDLSGASGKFVRFTASGALDLCGLGEPADGVVVGSPLAAIGSPVQVQRTGVGFVKLGATLNAGDFVTSSAAGLAVAITATEVDGAGPALKGSYVCARLQQGGNNGDTKRAYIWPYGALPATFL
jgi:hypothetical protein